MSGRLIRLGAVCAMLLHGSMIKTNRLLWLRFDAAALLVLCPIYILQNSDGF